MMLIKMLDAARHKWQRIMSGVSWTNELTTDESETKLGNKPRRAFSLKRTFRWLGHVQWMDHHSKHYTGRFPAGHKEDEADQEQSGEE